MLLSLSLPAAPSEWNLLATEAFAKSEAGWLALDDGVPRGIKHPAAGLAGKWLRFSGEVEDETSDIVFLLHAHSGEKLLDYSSGICHPIGAGQTSCEVLLHVPEDAETIGAFLWPRSGKAARLRNLRIEIGEGEAPRAKDSDRFNKLIDLFRTRYYRSQEVDWRQMEDELGSWLMPPNGTDPLPIIAGYLIRRLPGHEHSSVSARSAVDGSGKQAFPSCRRLATRLWQLTMPEFAAIEGPTREAYAREAQRCLLSHPASTRWVLDLRRNSGGNMYPMLAGLAPLLKKGRVLSFVDGEGLVVEWTGIFDDGVSSGEQIVFPIRTAVSRRSTTRTVVLTGKGCLSSCEAVLIALAERPHTLLVGEPSGGLTSSNGWHELNADYGLLLTESLMADRSGQKAPAHIPPDIKRKLVTPRSLKSLFSSRWPSERP